MLARHNQARGRRAWALNAAVGPPNGWLTFSNGGSKTGESSPGGHEGWGFRRTELERNNFEGQAWDATDVYATSLSEFMKHFLRKDQHVLMKMDIEGSEFTVLEDMLATGALGLIDALSAEFHPREVGPPGSPVRTSTCALTSLELAGPPTSMGTGGLQPLYCRGAPPL